MTAVPAKLPEPAVIGPPRADAGSRPLWSVVIPVRDRLTYLRRALDSVLVQAPDPRRMEIIVVDNSEKPPDFGAVLSAPMLDRIRIHRQAVPLGMIDNWNSCVGLASGELVHLLHDDDWVKPGFYATVESLAAAHPDLHFFAVRCIHVDADDGILRIVDRLVDWEKPTRDPSLFFLTNHVQCPAVVVRRSLYEKAGGFRLGLPYTADCEMWARAVARGGGILSPLPLACYRVHDTNATSRLQSSGDWLREQGRLRDLFGELYPAFDKNAFNRERTRSAFALVRRFETEGRLEEAAANRAAWTEIMPASIRRRHRLQAVVLRLLRPPLQALGLHLDRA